MTKEEFKKKIKEEKPDIGGWDIEPDFLTDADSVIGCYYNKQEKKWHIYETNERGYEAPIFKADNEEEAYDRLYDLVMIHKRLTERIKNDN